MKLLICPISIDHCSVSCFLRFRPIYEERTHSDCPVERSRSTYHFFPLQCFCFLCYFKNSLAMRCSKLGPWFAIHRDLNVLGMGSSYLVDWERNASGTWASGCFAQDVMTSPKDILQLENGPFQHFCSFWRATWTAKGLFRFQDGRHYAKENFRLTVARQVLLTQK